MTTKAIEAGAQALCRQKGYKPDQLEPGDIPRIDGHLPNGDPGHFMWRHFTKESQACIEAAIASGELVPASAVAADHIGHLEGGLQLLLKAVKAGDPQKEIIWRVEEELRQIARLRALEPASGEYVLVPRSPTVEMQRAGLHALENRGVNHCNCDQNDVWTAMLTAATSNGSGSK